MENPLRKKTGASDAQQSEGSHALPVSAFWEAVSSAFASADLPVATESEERSSSGRAEKKPGMEAEYKKASGDSNVAAGGV